MATPRAQAAARILLTGVCGHNIHMINDVTKINRPALMKFFAGEDLSQELYDRLGLFIFKKLNAHLLICDEDKQ